MLRTLSLKVEGAAKLFHAQSAEATTRVFCYINTFGDV